MLDQFRALKVWQRGDERAPHKPLLVLLVLGKYALGAERLIPYSEIDRPLRELLEAFGPPRKSYHSEYPFWRLQNDGIWELVNTENVESRKSNRDAKKSELLKHDVTGGLTADLYDAIQLDRSLIKRVSSDLLDRCFPESFHQEILNSVGLEDAVELIQRRKRDPKFRDQVLTAYEYRCAICGLNLRMGGRALGLEAAHIKWYQARGPDTVQNGLALCSLHHKLFDRGAIGLSDDRTLLVSEWVHGTQGLTNWLLNHHGIEIRPPQSKIHSPSPDFIGWHRKEVFRSPARRLSIFL
ncbi:phosphorothioated DNA-binding restriction endonuclease [Rosistilla ulvae]|uniref:phosphorothioated DNA-binding restriction endonuclease n=1 Tax=Rosistilla ulvae TaxID=1930277 RepID=UPI001C54C71C|nr:HNH endonuclease [Rosistilla ulvae]